MCIWRQEYQMRRGGLKKEKPPAQKKEEFVYIAIPGADTVYTVLQEFNRQVFCGFFNSGKPVSWNVHLRFRILFWFFFAMWFLPIWKEGTAASWHWGVSSFSSGDGLLWMPWFQCKTASDQRFSSIELYEIGSQSSKQTSGTYLYWFFFNKNLVEKHVDWYFTWYKTESFRVFFWSIDLYRSIIRSTSPRS